MSLAGSRFGIQYNVILLSGFACLSSSHVRGHYETVDQRFPIQRNLKSFLRGRRTNQHGHWQIFLPFFLRKRTRRENAQSRTFSHRATVNQFDSRHSSSVASAIQRGVAGMSEGRRKTTTRVHKSRVIAAEFTKVSDSCDIYRVEFQFANSSVEIAFNLAII